MLALTKKQLCDLLQLKASEGADFSVSSVTEDSRRVRPGSLFAAVSGTKTDGHDHVAQAVAAGACAVIGNRKDIEALHGVPYLHVADARFAAGLVAHALAGNPTALVDALNQLLLHGAMSTAVKSTVTSTVSALPATNPLARAQTALYLVASSSQYQVAR